jgi:HD superfamily phosphohydrolase
VGETLQHQLHRSFTLIGPDDEKTLAIDPDGVRALEQFVLAKYYLTTNVYRHRVRLITDQMIVRAVSLGIDRDGQNELRQVYTFDNSSDFFVRYVGWDDARLLMRFDDGAKPGTLCGQILGGLQSRKLHKQVYSERLQDLDDPAVRDRLLRITAPENSALRMKIEAAAADILKQLLTIELDKSTVILNGFNIQSVRSSSRNDEASIMIARSPAPQPFEQYSALFQSIQEGYADGSVEVYAPVEWETRADRRRVRNLLLEPLRSAIMTLTKVTLEQEKAIDSSLTVSSRLGSGGSQATSPTEPDHEGK